MLDRLSPEDQWMSKPSRRYVAQSMPYSGKFHAIWAAPGLIPRLVEEETRAVPEVFDTAEEAEEAARITLFERLNERADAKYKYSGKPTESARLNHAEFAAELADSDMNPEDFATVWGTTPGRVIEWIDGEKDIPFPIRWALPLLRLPGAKELVFKIVEANINFKPKWLAFDAKRIRVETLIKAITPQLPRNADETTFKFQRAVQSENLRIDDRLVLLEEVAAELALNVPAPATAAAARRG